MASQGKRSLGRDQNAVIPKCEAEMLHRRWLSPTTTTTKGAENFGPGNSWETSTRNMEKDSGEKINESQKLTHAKWQALALNLDILVPQT